jgi:hypothetical protein
MAIAAGTAALAHHRPGVWGVTGVLVMVVSSLA